MKIGFLFPGQGTQSVGMGLDLYQQFSEAKNIYHKVSEITGIDIKQISFNGPEEVLNKTQNTQLAVLTESLAILEILKKNNINAQMSAGLSLGEYTALIEDNILDFETGVKLVQKRGEIMQNKVPEGNWKMLAIMGLDENKISEICEQVSKKYFVAMANYNTMGQIVVAGEENGITSVSELAKENGARKVTILNTAGPFHTIKLKECAKALKETLDNINVNNKNSKVIKNLDGTLYNVNDDIKEVLAKHIMNPVRFTSCLNTMYDNGIDTFIEIGPGKTLSGFVKRMKFQNPINILNINNCASLEKTIKEVKENG